MCCFANESLPFFCLDVVEDAKAKTRYHKNDMDPLRFMDPQNPDKHNGGKTIKHHGNTSEHEKHSDLFKSYCLHQNNYESID